MSNGMQGRMDAIVVGMLAVGCINENEKELPALAKVARRICEAIDAEVENKTVEAKEAREKERAEKWPHCVGCAPKTNKAYYNSPIVHYGFGECGHMFADDALNGCPCEKFRRVAK